MDYCDVCGQLACSKVLKRWFCPQHVGQGPGKCLESRHWAEELRLSLQTELTTALRQLEAVKSQTEATVSAVFVSMHRQLLSHHTSVLKDLESCEEASKPISCKPRLLGVLVLPNSVEVAQAVLRTFQIAAEDNLAEYLQLCQRPTWRQQKAESLFESASRILQEQDRVEALGVALEYCLQAEALGVQPEFARGLLATAERRLGRGLEYAEIELRQYVAVRPADVEVALMLHRTRCQKKVHPDAKATNSAREISALHLEVDYFPSLPAAELQFRSSSTKEFGESVRDHSVLETEKLMAIQGYYDRYFADSAARLNTYVCLSRLDVPGAFDALFTLSTQEFAYTSAVLSALWTQAETCSAGKQEEACLQWCLKAEALCYPYTPYLPIVRQLQHRLSSLSDTHLNDKSQAITHLSRLLLSYPPSDHNSRNPLIDRISCELQQLARFQDAESCQSLLLRGAKSSRTPFTPPSVRKLRRLFD